ncbi:phage portal protein [Photobacterium aphoticum]|uniref:Phage portal protein n=1 Tax=Photobacterium aphoticum TaxID=754436 RepID=A0A090R181_9GAMM|nr:phage portal protein [Photobacterium aphoticum]
MIANLLRDAARKFIYRAIDIHTAYRDGKVWLPEQRPFEVTFNSMSTAIALEEESARETRATYCTLVATVLDQIEQSPIGKSETLKSHLYSEIGFSSELIKKITAELAKHAAESESQMMESLGIPQGHDSERYIRDVILDVINDFGTARE